MSSIGLRISQNTHLYARGIRVGFGNEGDLADAAVHLPLGDKHVPRCKLREKSGDKR